ncbi:MHYT domain-containing protein [Cellvibrio sp. NN19]|uniref:MHYT domain-containing protein n=1 Tax=Cellvibrio chitinivorans TaxID=3102792 RepID=UPI002B4092AE|nr:MHYT domain-containing protein [Cellvibrio sp. NN19]
MLDIFIDYNSQYSLIQGHHNPALVAVSILVAIISSMMALQIAGMARVAQGRLLRQIALISGSIALGGGIWSMHFIGMLAFELGTHVHYHPFITLGSMLPSVLASWVALHMLSHSSISKRQLAIGGVLVGAGIGAMHYSGMAAMDMGATLLYDPLWFIASIIVAVVMAMIALWVRFGLHNHGKLNTTRATLLSGVIMGCAIAAMHYTGMAAARFIGTPDAHFTADSSHSFLAFIISAMTVAISLLVIAGNLILRYRQLYRHMVKIERELSSREQQYRTLIANIPGVTFRTQANEPWQVIFISDAIEALSGWEAEKFFAHEINLGDIVHPDDVERISQELIPALDNKTAYVIEYRMRCRDNSERWVTERASGVYDEKGKLKWIDGVIIDITDSKAMQTDLVVAKDSAEQAATAKGMFLANMSHEIRTPMNAIIGFTELLLDSPQQPEQLRHLQTVNRSARSLLSLLNDILDTAKLERGAVELDTKAFSLHEAVQQIINEQVNQAQKKGLQLSVNFAKSMRDFVLGDELRLRQILLNLIGNAIKFTQHGSVTLDISEKNDRVIFKVIDTGIGIPADRIQHIFTPFTQADASMARRFGGTGLGTTIARQLTELMGGSINVTSELNQGSCFEVELPLPATEAIKPISAATTISLPILHILIADDVPQNIEVLQLMLTRDGHRTITASNGMEAFEQFKKHKFDLVLMDIQMPEVDGLQACRMIRQWEREQAVEATPIIALTASVLEQDRKDASTAGMNGFASKPIVRTELHNEIARCLGLIKTEATPTQNKNELTQDIDWQSAEQRWGDRTALTKAIQSFFADNTKPTAFFMQPENQHKHLEAQQEAHRIKGAAANLGLISLMQVAQQIEQSETMNADLFEQMKTAFENIIAQIKPIETDKTNSAIHHQWNRALLEKLLAAYSHGTFDDEAYRELTKTISSEHIAPLEQALDQFDFDLAANVIQSWIDQSASAQEV